MEHDGNDLKVRIENSAEKLDGIEPATPEFAFFSELVRREQARRRRSQRVQLALFTVVAAALVSAILVCAGRFEIFLVALQGAALLVAAVSLVVAFTRRPAEGLQR